MSPQKLSCDKFSTGTLDLIHKSVFLLNFWGESCLSTVLTKEDRSRSHLIQAFSALLNWVMMPPFHNQMHEEEKTIFSSLC